MTAIDVSPFDLLGDLPTGTTVLEASAGTGKTYAVGALVTRYVAEGSVKLEEMLVITFGRAASQELRERVRAQLVEAERKLADPVAARAAGGVIGLIAAADDQEVAARRLRIAAALASYDAATIATTHQFCQLVLRSLGVAGDTDASAELVDDLSELVEEVVDDLYLRRFGQRSEPPPFDRKAAMALARTVVGDPHARLHPQPPEQVDDRAELPDLVSERTAFARAVLEEVRRRKNERGLLSYDDLLSRLANALDGEDPPARERMRHRWQVVLVDEFQDTDPVQWQVLDRAFSGAATMVLIGDPKQAIYAFRGGDVDSYLAAVRTAGTVRTLATNRRSDKPLVDALQVMMHGVALGNEAIKVHRVEAADDLAGSRLVGAPSGAPVRLRQVRMADFDSTFEDTVKIDKVRPWIARDLAADVARLLGSGATYPDPVTGEPRPVEAGDVAILMSSLKHVQLFRDELSRWGIPSVITSGSNVLLGRAGDEWLALLEAMEQPARTGRIRSLALTSFVGISPEQLDQRGDHLTDEVAETVRGWLDLFRSRGVAAVYEAINAGGLAARLLSEPDGARVLTDLQHLAQVLHEVSRRDGLGLAALLTWLRHERVGSLSGTERTRRLDTDAAAVQIATIHGSKGLQYPIVYLPLAFTAWIDDKATAWRFHDEDGHRSLDVGGAAAPEIVARAKAEDLGEELRKTYVALTRAQSQVVLWWASCWDSGSAGLTRMLLGRPPGSDQVPDRLPRGFTDELVSERLGVWAEAGAFALEPSVFVATTPPDLTRASPALAVRTLDREIDRAWRRTSYSGLIKADEPVSSQTEPEVGGKDDEGGPDDDGPAGTVPSRVPVEGGDDNPVSPMTDLPGGATFGSLVHGVLEHADPDAPDQRAELLRHVEEQRQWWSVNATSEELVDALLPVLQTPMGPLADDLRLLDIGLGDRLAELDFEIPMVGGDTVHDAPDIQLGALAAILRRHLPADDPMLAYADQLEGTPLGKQSLRGYLSGSIDVVLRIPDGDGHRYVVVDYKTNRLGERGQELTAHDYRPDAVAAAMLHSHYPLQALLYAVVLHRFLRWRLADYQPERHLGGVLYLFLRGMCGPATPRFDGVPCGVFSWKPPSAMILAISALLDGSEGGR